MCKEKIKKGNKGTWALLLSIVALVLCIAVFLLWIFEMQTKHRNDYRLIYQTLMLF